MRYKMLNTSWEHILQQYVRKSIINQNKQTNTARKGVNYVFSNAFSQFLTSLFSFIWILAFETNERHCLCGIRTEHWALGIPSPNYYLFLNAATLQTQNNNKLEQLTWSVFRPLPLSMHVLLYSVRGVVYTSLTRTACTINLIGY